MGTVECCSMPENSLKESSGRCGTDIACIVRLAEGLMASNDTLRQEMESLRERVALLEKQERTEEAGLVDAVMARLLGELRKDDIPGGCHFYDC